MEAALGRDTMSDKAFAKAMSQIASEAEAEQKREIKAEERRRFQSKIRRICLFLTVTVVLGAGFYFRQNLEQYASKVTNKLSAPPKIDGQTATALNDLRTGAAKRDQVLDEIGKTPAGLTSTEANR